jgi:hypothetical protein
MRVFMFYISTPEMIRRLVRMGVEVQYIYGSIHWVLLSNFTAKRELMSHYYDEWGFNNLDFNNY